MAETVLAGEKIEEFTLRDAAARLALRDAIIPELPNDFFMRDSPRNGCDGKRQDKQIQHLLRRVHCVARSIKPYEHGTAILPRP